MWIGIVIFLVAGLVYGATADCGNCDDQAVVKDPVCAYDGQNYHTFQNPCFYKLAVCKYALAGYRLTLVHTGECTRTGSVDTGTRCPTTCPSESQPVCGTDGNTYQNKCFFLQAQCKYAANNMKLDIAHEGRCDSANTLTGVKPGTMLVDPGTSTGVKPGVQLVDPGTSTGVKPSSLSDACSGVQTCDATFVHLLCGTDGVTYVSKCDFLAAQCKAHANGLRLEVAYEGRCDSKPTTGTGAVDHCHMNCDPADKYPICGTDGVTYQNKCFFYETKCIKDATGERFDVAHVGACKSTEPSLSAVGRDVRACLSDVRCDNTPERICGSDGHTYGSECEFLRAQCNNPRLTRVRCFNTLG